MSATEGRLTPRGSVPPTRAASVTNWLTIGAACGLVTGLLEVFVALWPVIKPQTPWPGLVLFNPHRLWLKPVVDATLFASAAGGAALVQSVVPRLPSRLIVWALLVLAGLSVLLPYDGVLTTRTVLLLAAGAAVPLSAWFAARWSSWPLARLRWFVAIAVVSVAGAGGLRMAARSVAELRGRGGLSPASAGAPNVVLVVLDTVGAGDFGSRRAAAPAFARLAQDGVLFERAFATSSWTLETHASLFTGRYPHEVFHEGQTPLNDNAPLPGDMPTIAEIFGAHGYVTGGFAANHDYASRAHGLQRGFLHYEDYALNADAVLSSPAVGAKVLDMFGWWQRRPLRRDHLGATAISGAFLDWFDAQQGRPVLAFLNFMDAHDPYVPPDAYWRPDDGPRPGSPYVAVFKQYSAGEAAAMRAAYDACLRYLDAVLGELTQALSARGVLDNTILVVTSDHGEQFGEHGLMTHGNSLYRPVLQVPFAIRFPRKVTPQAHVTEPVSLRDIPATILDLAGLSGTVPGASLAPLWNGAAATAAPSPILSTIVIGREPHRWAPTRWPVSRGAMRSLVAAGYHYIRNGDGVEELYDLEADRDETLNLSDRADRAGVLRQLRDELFRLDPASDDRRRAAR